MEDFVDCVRIAVYCVENDPINVKNGEPKFLGFNFFVKRKDAEDMVKYIREALESLEIPYDGIDILGSIELPVTKIWGKETIMMAIKAGRNYLISESEKRAKQK